MDRRLSRFPARHFNAKKGTVTLTIETEDGDEIETDFPAKFEVCGTCEGEGTHVNPSVDSHGISQEEFDEDPDFREKYMSGQYDVTCNECRGLRVVPAVNVEACDAVQQADLAIWETQEADRCQYDRERAHECEMGY